MPKNKPTTFKQRIEFIKSLEEFFVAYEPKFGEKIKVRRFLQGLKELRADQKDGMIQSRLKRIKDTNIKKSDVTFLKSLEIFSILLSKPELAYPYKCLDHV